MIRHLACQPHRDGEPWDTGRHGGSIQPSDYWSDLYDFARADFSRLAEANGIPPGVLLPGDVINLAYRKQWAEARAALYAYGTGPEWVAQVLEQVHREQEIEAARIAVITAELARDNTAIHAARARLAALTNGAHREAA